MSRRIAFNIKSTNTQSFSGLPTQVASRNRRRNRSLSMMTKKKPEKNEIVSLNNAKDKVTELSNVIQTMIDSNESTPDVQTTLKPLLNGMNKGYPRFCKLGEQFFNFIAERRTKNSRQAFSTGPIKPAMQEFTKYFNQIVNLMNEYAKTGPKPHEKEIDIKFKSISISLDKVFNANLSRKYPSQTIANSIRNIQILTDQIDVTVMDLYKNPSFANLPHDIATMYVNDVQAIMNRLNSAFKFDLIQCGLATHEYQRIRLSIMVSCSTIINSLKASFEFPKQVEKAQFFIGKIKEEIQWVIDEVNSNFCTAKEKNVIGIIEESAKVKPKKVEKKKEEKKSLLMEFVGVNGDYKMDQKEIKLRMFLHEVLPLINEKYVGSGDVWEMLNTVEKKANYFNDKIKALEKEIKESNYQREEAQSIYNQNEKLLNNKIVLLTEKLNNSNKVIKKILDENNSIKKGRDSLIKEIDSKQEVIDEMIIKGDPNFLRNSLKKLINEMLSEIGENQKPKIKSDRELVDFSFSTLEKLEKKSLNDVEKLKMELKEALEEKDLQIKEMQSNIVQFPKKDLAFVSNTNKRRELRVAIAKPSNSSKRKSQIAMQFYKNEKKLDITEFLPIVEMLDALTGKNYREDKIPDVNALKDTVAKEIDVITEALTNCSEKITETTFSLNKVENILLNEGCKEKDVETALINLISRLKNSSNPLKEDITIKDKEIEELHSNVLILEERIKGIAKSIKISINNSQNVFEILELIQDTCITNSRKFLKYKEESDTLRNCLKEMETNLLRTIGKKLRYSKNDDDLVKNVFKYMDEVCEEKFSQDFIQKKEIALMFNSLKGEFNLTSPNQYIPEFIRKYEAYKAEINSLEPIYEILTSIIKNVGKEMNATEKAFVRANISSANNIISKLMMQLEERTAVKLVSQCLSLITIII